MTRRERLRRLAAAYTTMAWDLEGQLRRDLDGSRLPPQEIRHRRLARITHFRLRAHALLGASEREAGRPRPTTPPAPVVVRRGHQ